MGCEECEKKDEVIRGLEQQVKIQSSNINGFMEDLKRVSKERNELWKCVKADSLKVSLILQQLNILEQEKAEWENKVEY